MATIIFETPEALAAGQVLFGERLGPSFALDPWIEKLFPPPLREGERLELFQTLLPEPSRPHASKLLNAVERLRDALIFSEEDIEFAFSALAPTETLRQIRAAFVLYRQEPRLCEDRAARRQWLLEKLKEGAIRVSPQERELIFVPSIGPSSFSFGEITRTLPRASGLEQITVKELWELGSPGHAFRRPLLFQGTPATTLERYVLRIARERSRHPQKRIVLFFSGEPKARSALRLLLGHHRLPFYFLGSPSYQVDALPILPFLPAPAMEGLSVFGYADESLSLPPASAGLLGAAQGEPLRFLGFDWPTPADFRARSATLLEAFLMPRRNRPQLWTPLPIGELPLTSGRQVEIRGVPKAPPYRGDWGAQPLAAKRLWFSASLLETYARCPAAAFFAHELGLRPRLQGEEALAAVLGQLTHQALEWAYQSGEIPPPQAVLQACFERALEQFNPQTFVEPYRVPLRIAFTRLTRALPGMEKSLDEALGKRRVRATESSFELTLEGVALKGKIDRLDETEDGRLFVIDYKTGTVDFTPAHVLEGHHFQALVYALASERLWGRIDGVVFADLKRGEARRGLLRLEALTGKGHFVRGHGLAPEQWEELRRSGWERLNAIAKAIAQGNFLPLPSREACEKCDYLALCRRSFSIG